MQVLIQFNLLQNLGRITVEILKNVLFAKIGTSD